MNYHVTVEKDKEPCPLSKVRMFTARCHSHKIYSSGFSDRQAIDSVFKRILTEVKDPEPSLSIERLN
tara:strand:- start:85 stop:285 length:201 start_codon:yes stop_codon:yes gene_type:complete